MFNGLRQLMLEMSGSQNFKNGIVLFIFSGITFCTGMGAILFPTNWDFQLEFIVAMIFFTFIFVTSGFECWKVAYKWRIVLPEPPGPPPFRGPRKIVPRVGVVHPTPELAAQKPPRYTAQSEREITRFFGFVYCVIELGYTSEKKWPELGVTGRQYRDWMSIEALANPTLHIVSAPAQGRRVEVYCDFQEALRRIAVDQKNPWYWYCAYQWYAKDENWQAIMRINLGGQKDSTPLMRPIIPPSL